MDTTFLRFYQRDAEIKILKIRKLSTETEDLILKLPL